MLQILLSLKKLAEIPIVEQGGNKFPAEGRRGEGRIRKPNTDMRYPVFFSRYLHSAFGFEKK
jgi:hypothetical protein